MQEESLYLLAITWHRLPSIHINKINHLHNSKPKKITIYKLYIIRYNKQSHLKLWLNWCILLLLIYILIITFLSDISIIQMLQIEILVSGRVQGVNFRNYVYRKALQLSLNGYVRNLYDGRVEILAQGERDDIEALIDFVRSSPGLSFVTDLDINWREPSKKFDNFRISY